MVYPPTIPRDWSFPLFVFPHIAVIFHLFFLLTLLRFLFWSFLSLIHVQAYGDDVQNAALPQFWRRGSK